MRVYQGDSIIPNDPRPHTFVEVDQNKFLEIECPPLEKLTPGDKQRLRAFTRKIRTGEKRDHIFYIRMAYRYFKCISPVPNLRLVGEF